MESPSLELQQLNASTVSIELPSDVAQLLKDQARRNRKSIAAIIAEWLQDQADAREADRRWKSLQSGKTKAVTSDQVYQRLGI